MNVAAINCNKLSKRYGRSGPFALKDLSIKVLPGEVYGFLGPNGAGKSTTIRTLLNFLQPTSGTATINGLDIIKDSTELKRQIGYLSGDMAMYRKLTGRQFLDFMHDLLPAASQKYRRELEERFKVDTNKPLGDLSRGNRQKIGIVQAFMHKPSVLILDEPTSGLDPLMQEEFYNLVNETKKRGAAIFSSSHFLSEVQKMCDRVGIIREGELIAEKSIADLAAEAAQTFDIVFADKAPISELKKLSGIKIVDSKDNNVTLHVHSNLKPLLKLLGQYDVKHLDSQSLDLEQIFIHYYTDSKRNKS